MLECAGLCCGRPDDKEHSTVSSDYQPPTRISSSIGRVFHPVSVSTSSSLHLQTAASFSFLPAVIVVTEYGKQDHVQTSSRMIHNPGTRRRGCLDEFQIPVSNKRRPKRSPALPTVLWYGPYSAPPSYSTNTSRDRSLRLRPYRILRIARAPEGEMRPAIAYKRDHETSWVGCKVRGCMVRMTGLGVSYRALHQMRALPIRLSLFLSSISISTTVREKGSRPCRIIVVAAFSPELEAKKMRA